MHEPHGIDQLPISSKWRKGIECYYIGGFDPEWARYGPGSITVLAAIRAAALEGAREFHFLRGRG